ncbi:MAG: penicillin amidase [Candidatus Hydrogenedentota bacterium]
MKFLRRLAKWFAVTVVLLVTSGAVAVVYLANSRLPELEGTVIHPSLHGEVRVVRDSVGVPHIAAGNEPDAYFALGYCMAQDRLFQMELMRRLARGELAEVAGPPALPIDRAVRAFRLRAKAEAYFADSGAQPPELTALMDAYLAGVNAFIAEGPIPFELIVLGVDVRPFTKVDCLAVAAILPITFADGIRGDPLVTMLKAKHPDLDIDALFPGYTLETPVTIMETLEEAAAYLESHREEDKADEPIRYEASLSVVNEWLTIFGAISQRFGPAMGSNSWVLAPSRTQSGEAILANDPHIAFSNPSILYEAHLKYGDFENYGFHLPPIPIPLMGHNRQRAWALTMTAQDDTDFYLERFHPDDPDKVMYKGEWVDVETATETIKVRFSDNVECRVRVTPHGPVLNDFLKAYHGYDDAPVSLSWIWQHLPYTDITAFYRMGHAQNCENFGEAVSLITSPGMNISFADADGNIAWWATGKIPIRPDGMNSKQILDGASGRDEILGYLPFDQNPHLKNPDCGFIASANNKPTVKPVGAVKDIQGYWQPTDRAGRIEELVSARADWTVEALKVVQFDDTSRAGPEVVTQLVDVVDAQRVLLTPWEQDVLDRLKAWDFRHDVDSVGATIYEHLNAAILKRALTDEMGVDLFKVYATLADHWHFYKHFIGDEASPFWDDVTTIEREQRPEIVLAAFKDMTRRLTRHLGGDVSRWTWGRAHTMEFKHPFGYLPVLDRIFNVGPYPASGGAQVLNNMLYDFAQDEFTVIAGPATRRLIDFASPEDAQVILPTGNSGNFMSPHYGDQAERFMNGEYRRALLDAEDIELDKAHELRFVPGE